MPGTIIYTGYGRCGNQKLDAPNHLLNAIDSETVVPLFNKLSVGRWEFTGLWRVRDGADAFDADAVSEWFGASRWFVLNKFGLKQIAVIAVIHINI